MYCLEYDCLWFWNKRPSAAFLCLFVLSWPIFYVYYHIPVYFAKHILFYCLSPAAFFITGFNRLRTTKHDSTLLPSIPCKRKGLDAQSHTYTHLKPHMHSLLDQKNRGHQGG